MNMVERRWAGPAAAVMAFCLTLIFVAPPTSPALSTMVPATIVADVVDVDVECELSGPRTGFRRHHAAVDAAFAASVDQRVVELRDRLRLPVEDLGVEVAEFCGIGRPELPVHNRPAHIELLGDDA